MQPTTIKLLDLLRSAAPERSFEVRPVSTPCHDDWIGLAGPYCLRIDSRVDPPMVVLTDENPDGGQIEFWFVKDSMDLPSIICRSLEYEKRNHNA